MAEKIAAKRDGRKSTRQAEKVILVAGSITVDELSRELGLPVTEVVGELFRQGIVATINQRLDLDTATLMVEELGIKGVRLERKQNVTKMWGGQRELSDKAVARPPVVAVMGHVDHGKTTLLDALLKKKTAATEVGGITQQISAYQWEGKDGRTITFLDTPGHEAFAAVRQHGANLTDIVVIVVAADDGVKPQTIEAIEFAKSAHAKIIVAINKIDREGADIPRTMAELSEHGLQPEEWGGDVVMVPISAKRQLNLDKLTEMILLVADLAEVKADMEIPAEGLVIESHLDIGKGPVVNLLVMGGELKVGKIIVAGKTYAKIRTMVDWRGRPKGKAGPAMPVTVTGFKELPEFGERFWSALDEKTARRQALLNAKELAQSAASANVTSKDLLRMMATADTAETLNVVIKGDVLGAATSVEEALKMIDTKGKITLNIVVSGVGEITENDIYLGTGENTVVYGFRVGMTPQIKKLAERNGVEVKLFDVIYELLDDAKAEMEKLLPAEMVETELGEMEIKGVFRIMKKEVIAGGEVISGIVRAGNLARVKRNGEILAEATIESVEKEKTAVEELVAGEVGGIALKTERRLELKIGDRLEIFQREERAGTLE